MAEPTPEEIKALLSRLSPEQLNALMQRAGEAQKQQGPTNSIEEIAKKLLTEYAKNKGSSALSSEASSGMPALTAGSQAVANSLSPAASSSFQAMNDAGVLSDSGQAAGLAGSQAANGGASLYGKLTGPGNIGQYGGYAMNALNAYNALNNPNLNGTQKAQALQKQAGLAVANYYTGGLAQLGYEGLSRTGIGKKALAMGDKVDAAINPVTMLAGGFLDSDKWKTEGDRLRALQKGGMNIPTGALGPENLTHGRTDDQLQAIAQATGTPQDVKFAKSRDVNDLKGSGQSIVNYAAFGEHDPNWFNRPMAERIAYANKLLDQGAVNEHNGTIDVNWDQASPLPASAPGKPAGGPQTIGVPRGTGDALQNIAPSLANHPAWGDSGPSGHWVDAQGNPLTGDSMIDPGFTMGNKFIPNSNQWQPGMPTHGRTARAYTSVYTGRR
jgi:hypothetical protein